MMTSYIANAGAEETTRQAAVWPSEVMPWIEAKPGAPDNRGMTLRLTNAHDQNVNITNYHRVSTPFSPDGRYFLDTSRRRGGEHLCLVDLGAEGQIIDLGARSPARNNLWDISGRRIYSRMANPGKTKTTDLYETDIADLPTVRERRLTRFELGPGSGEMDGIGALSPNGELLTFSYASGANKGDATARGNSGNVDRLGTLSVAGPYDEPIRDPDGKRLIVRQTFPPTVNVKAIWVGNGHIVWGHKEGDCPGIPERRRKKSGVELGHIHFLDITLPKEHPDYDRVLAIAGHSLAHPDQLHAICADGGVDLAGKRHKEGGAAFGVYDVRTGVRQSLPVTSFGAGSHPNCSPDGLWWGADKVWPEYHNWVCVFRLDGKSPMIPLVEHGMHPIPLDKSKRTERVPWDRGEPYHHVSVHWSPDATKIAWGATSAAADPFKNHTDVFMTLFQAPAGVTAVKARKTGDSVTLGWRPDRRHREVSYYHIFRRVNDYDPQEIAAVPQRNTWLAGARHLSAGDTVITVESTDAFPPKGLLELQPTRTVDQGEIVRYTSKDKTHFLGVTRGVSGSAPAEHYVGAFVWYWPEEEGYVDKNPPANAAYSIQTEEWSGLTSAVSAEARAR